jgi:hypothetical protein
MFIFYVSCNFPLNSTFLDTKIVWKKIDLKNYRILKVYLRFKD